MSDKKFIPYSTQCIDRNDINAVAKVLKSDWLTQGPKIREFESEISAYCGAKYAVAVSSGTAALHIACLAANIKPGDEVITSPMTFVASANCILYCRGKPIFADIQKDIANINPAEIKKKINKKTKAIIPVHYSGHPCDLEEINRIAKDNNLTIIEDAAHALGAEYKDSKIGSCKFSDMTILSFHPVKLITTGEGGVVLTNKKYLYEKLLMLRNHGITKESSKFKVKNPRSIGGWFYEMQELGFNYRITDFQCTLGLNQLKKIDSFIKRRREIVNIYNQNLSTIKEIILPVEKKYVKSAWHLYYIRLKDHRKRKDTFEKLRKLGIGTQVHYIPVYFHPYYLRMGYKIGICSNAEEFYKRELSLPLYQSLRNKDLRFIINKFLNLFK